MDYTEYLRELEEYLDVLPPEIKKAALEYYKKLFEESGEAGEMGVLLRLGSAFSLAKKIIAEKSDYTDTDSYKALKLDFPEYAFPEAEAESAPAPSVGADSIRPQNISDAPAPSPAEYKAPPPPTAYQAALPRASFEKPQTDFARDMPAGAAPPPVYQSTPSTPPPPPVGFNALPRVEVRGSGYGGYQGTARERSAKNNATIIGVLIAMGVLVAGLIGIFSMFSAFIGNATVYDDAVEVTVMPGYENAFQVPEVPEVPAVPEIPAIPGAPAYQYIFSGDINDLHLYSYGANVTVIMDSEFKIESDRDTAEPGVFDVDFTDGNLSVSAFPEAGNVTIHVPNYIYGIVDIYAEGGLVHINNINAPELNLYAEDASIELYDNTFWRQSYITTDNCTYYSSNNTFNGNTAYFNDVE
jgi:hypothetical protein